MVAKPGSAGLTAFYKRRMPLAIPRHGLSVFCWLLRGEFGKASELNLGGNPNDYRHQATQVPQEV